MAKLLHKLLITGDIIVHSGLHIGGSEVDLDIGGIDKEVVKVKLGNRRIPYIPGSSLKGKLRSLIARQKGYKELKNDEKETLALFGSANFKKNIQKIPSRLIVRDNYLKDEQEYQLEDKAENTINRLTGEANPRHLERVSKGTVFSLDMIMDVYEVDDQTKLLDTLGIGFQLLKRDYLGGGGTRGSGKVEIRDISIEKIVFLNDGSVAKSGIDYSFNLNEA